ncbi:divergent polysaccharide deacetylase family protein [Notoacmeibacter sp. MSK16QG-6]|uniref:divergent polysaccharide deacetylase family protein n=1 Tax=Notoacmeibacter sp. MSK16QG-6 TaxID=2957982 RepID=UPI0020A03908|nr:divergent polysaccharide deacetylase family protein [Notoacmeibacter sp. MSK16QG-6]MCP1200958.1 divergent polysaccharide deacetylase family protein [Notoacmeibacter sp. MSK16QG-6]
MNSPNQTDAATRSIDRPLGLDRPAAEPNSPRRFRMIGHGGPALLALLLLAGSVWTATYRDPLRSPARPADTDVATADNTPAEPPTPPEEIAAPAAPTIRSPGQRIDDGSGPAIIRVAPDDQSMPDLPDGTNPAETGGAIIVRDASSLSVPIRLSSQPKPALIESSSAGPLPKIGPDGERPFDAYRRPAEQIDGPAIALIVGGLGLSQTGTQHAIKTLPGTVTLAFAPTGNSLSRWQQAARQAGHELLLQLPMEPFGYPNTNPGPGTLLADATSDETLALTRKALAATTNYAGIINYMGGRFLTENAALQPIVEELAGRGLMFVDDGTAPASQAGRLSAIEGAPFAMAGDPVDTIREPEMIRRALTALETKARENGAAIATASAFRVTVDELSQWMDKAAARGIRFVPVSALAQDNR